MSSHKRNIGLFSFGIGNVSGGGGAERFFADFFDEYRHSRETAYNLHWLLDNSSIHNLLSVGKLRKSESVHSFRVFSNRLKYLLENMQLLFYIFRHRISLVHIPLYNVHYLPFLRFLNKLPKFLRPALTINIVDCSLPFCFFDTAQPRHRDVVSTWEVLFRKIEVDGYIAWNRSFVEFAENHNLLAGRPYLFAIRSRFCKTDEFFPDKKNKTVVFASRLAVYKNADWYLKAVALLAEKHPADLVGWKFLVCGDGPLRENLQKLAAELQIERCVEFVIEPRLQKILNHSTVFVSCQDFDNFPSMSMAEALAAGNVVVSRNVGQTGLFVREGYNGFLAVTDDVPGIAGALHAAITARNLEALASNSVRLMKEVHTVPAFVEQIDKFWNATLDKKKDD